MPRLLVIDDRDQTVEMVHRQLPQFDTVTRCERRIPCQVCEERTRGCPLEAKSALPREPKPRRTAVEGLRRRQGLLILEKLRASYPTLPVVMLTTTGSDLGADRPEDPLV